MLHGGGTGSDRVSEFIDSLSEKRSSEWAWEHYKDTVLGLMTMLDARRVMEIGGGRWPLFYTEEILSGDIRYISNDISRDELALAPSHVETACFDIGQKAKIEYEELYGQIDLMFSKMVFEHVADTRQAYKNIYLLLSQGGVCLNFHPVLYSPPFVINRIMPETMSSRLLRTFFPHRHWQDVPKHPARYDHCVISKPEQEALLAIGYRKVWQVPFWYHNYFKRIPGLYHLDLAAAKFADRHNLTSLASFCYTLVMK